MFTEGNEEKKGGNHGYPGCGWNRNLREGVGVARALRPRDRSRSGGGQLGEAVKKSKTEKIRLRKPLICRERNLCFRAICQFFHSFGEPALPPRPTGQPPRQPLPHPPAR